MRTTLTALTLVLFAAVAPAHAEVVSSSPAGFVLHAQAEVPVPPERTWRRLGQLDRWWSGGHTYSGDSANLRLDLRPGGCWCERWGAGQFVEHGRVVLILEREGVRTLRVAAPLGPLQELAVNGVLTFTVAPHANGAHVTMTYRVAGDPSLNLDQFAPLVDGVLMEQFGRLSRYSASGSPD